MIAALDATPLTVATGGIPRYVAELHRALAALYPEDQFPLLTDQPVAPGAGMPVEPPPAGALARRWWLAGLPRELRRRRADLFHGTDFSVPYLPVCASVMTVHDLSPWMDPGWHDATADRIRRRTPLLLRLGLATMVITVSEAVRRAAIARFHLDPARVAAVPLAAGERFRPVERAPGTPPYFLYVGTLEPRKNLPMAVEAWAAGYAEHRTPLWLAGRLRADGPALPEHPALRRLGAVSEAELPGLYANAVAVLYPSLYEGFGLPVLEAMRSGAALLASTDAAVTEVAGGAAWHGAPEDGRAWCAAMIDCVRRPEFPARLREAGLRRAAGFSWERTARETYAVYEEALRRYR